MGISLRAPSARRPRQKWLAGHRCSSWRRTSLLPLTAIRTGHLHERSATHHGSTHRHGRTHWSTNRHRCTHRRRSTHRHRRTHRNRSTHRHRSTDGRRHNCRNGPGQSHRNASHFIDGSAGRTACARCRRSGTSRLARLCLEAFVAAGYQRGGRNVRAQRQCDPTQPSPSSSNPDVESIKDRHRPRTLRFVQTFRIQLMQQSRMSFSSRG